MILALLLAAAEIGWQYGPTTISLPGGEALRLPRGIIYVQGRELERFLSATGNQIEGAERLVFAPENVTWFAVVSYRAEPLDQARAWTEQQTEPDGRRTTNHHLWRPVAGGRLEYELISNPAEFVAHRSRFDGIVKPYSKQPTPWPYTPFLLAAVVLLLLIWRVYYSQAQREST